MSEKESEEGLVKIRKTMNIVLRSFGFFSWEPVSGGGVEGPAASPEFVESQNRRISGVRLSSLGLHKPPPPTLLRSTILDRPQFLGTQTSSVAKVGSTKEDF